MNLRRSSTEIQSIPQTITDRCQELGLISWRLDLNGMPNNEPTTTPIVSLYLRSREVRTHFVQAAMIWSSQDEPEPIEVISGMWLFPFTEVHRGRRNGYFVVIGFGRDAIDSDLIEQTCIGDKIYANTLRHQIKELVSIVPCTAPQIFKTLKWMINDQVQLTNNEQTIDQFSDQLADSYEVVTTLQDLGRSMSVFGDLENILLNGIEEIASTLEYNWAACVLDPHKDASTLIQNKCLQTGCTQLAESEIQHILQYIQESEPLGNAGHTHIYAVPMDLLDLEPQLLSHPITRDGFIIGRLIVAGKNGDDPQVSSHETNLLESVSGMLGACIENAELYHQQQLTFLGTIQALSAAIDAKDQYTQGHSERVAMLSKLLALKVGYGEEDAERVRISGLLHDVGKIGVAESVLCKPGRLTDSEFDQIKEHPQIGYNILQGIPALSDTLPGVLHHHERWDGNGYPHQLAGEDIPQVARIMALADTFDAMSSNRAYRSKLSRDVVFDEIRKSAGTQFDPKLVDLFLELDFSIYDEMVAQHKAQAPTTKAAA